MSVIEAVKEKLEIMKESPIDTHNEYTFENSLYERRIASKLLLYIRLLEKNKEELKI